MPALARLETVTDVSALLELVLSTEGADPVAETIVDAALEEFLAYGLRRTNVDVVAKLYEVHKQRADVQVLVSNELRDQLARTLSEDERRIAVIKPERP